MSLLTSTIPKNVNKINGDASGVYHKIYLKLGSRVHHDFPFVENVNRTAPYKSANLNGNRRAII